MAWGRRRSNDLVAAATEHLKVRNLDRPTMQNRIDNVRSAQDRFLKAMSELRAARLYLDSAQEELAKEVNQLDCGVAASVSPITDEQIMAYVNGSETLELDRTPNEQKD